MIHVTKTFLPPIKEYLNILNKAWDEQWIANRGKLVLQLENKLKEYLGVTNILATTNGTLPLQISIKALDLQGEIITTPFSYVATTSSIVWENCTPIFVDIDLDYLTIDETKIEKRITNKTSAILATHVFGNPCNVEKIHQIAKKYNIKVIYDAAHCFGVKYKNKSLFSYGDISTCSFHATKIFHTGEGGALFTKNEDLHEKLFSYHNFGHKGQEDFTNLGINAKMSELQAAMGLAVLPYINKIIKDRENIVKFYLKELEYLKTIKIREDTNWNYAYFPIILKTEKELLKIKKGLEEHNIYPRRYFYPSLDRLPYTKESNCYISHDIVSRILCLPIYTGLSQIELKKICKIINRVL